MKRLVSALACILLLLTVVLTVVACNTEEVDSLVIYNWADYIFDEDLKEFKTYYEQVTGKPIEITYVTFDTNETMLTRLTQGDSNVDVVCPSEYAIQKLWESDLLLPLNYSNEAEYTKDFSESTKANYVHNYNNVETRITDKVEQTFGDMVNYFVPYMYGTLGILYNKYAFIDMGIYEKDIMNQANWGILFNDDGNGGILHKDLTGNILMKDSIRDSYAATIFYLKERGKLDGLVPDDISAGELINSVDDNLLEIVRNTLIEQKSQLFGYEVDFGKDDLLQGNAIVDLAWSGDAMYAVEESWSDDLGDDGDYELAYYVPHGAGNIWFDGWVVPKKTYNPEHMDAIKIFINYLNNPEVAARNLLEIGYTPAVRSDILQENDEALKVLMNAYDYDFDNAKDKLTFISEFFEYEDDIDSSNWRYPFESAPVERDPLNPYDRSLSTLGVMRDFGENNKKVVTMWNHARSAGVNALPLLGYTALAVAVAVGAVFATIGIKRWKSKFVRCAQNDSTSQDS